VHADSPVESSPAQGNWAKQAASLMLCLLSRRKEGWKEEKRRQTIISQFYRGLLAFVGSLPFSSRLVQNVQARGGPFLPNGLFFCPSYSRLVVIWMATAAPIQFVAGTALKIVIIVGSNPFSMQNQFPSCF
jgi:hypothetical protein